MHKNCLLLIDVRELLLLLLLWLNLKLLSAVGQPREDIHRLFRRFVVAAKQLLQLLLKIVLGFRLGLNKI
jgi:hypothetical protein